MEIVVLSNNSEILKIFHRIQRKKDISVKQLSLDGSREALRALPPCQIVYLDISDLSENERRKHINNMKKNRQLRLGIIDPDGDIDSVSVLFHQGFADYISSADIQKGIDAARIQDILSFKECRLPGEYLDNFVPQSNFITVENGWNDVKQGKEYTFCILYIRFDRQYELKKKFGHIYNYDLGKNFREFINDQITVLNGKIWLWDNNDGIILFPFNGMPADVLVKCYQIMRDRLIYSVEVFEVSDLVNFTFILHIGNIKYQEGSGFNKGSTISDSLNFIYHMAEYKAETGRMYVSETLFPFIPRGLEDLFINSEEFEGRKFKKLKKQQFK